MQLYKHLMKSIFGKAALAAVVLSGILLFAGAPSAKANDWDDCNRRVASRVLAARTPRSV